MDECLIAHDAERLDVALRATPHYSANLPRDFHV
jgi:hypothetical protein